MRTPAIGTMVSPIENESGYGILCRTAWSMGFHNLKELSNHLIPSVTTTEHTLSKEIELTLISAWSLCTLKLSPFETADRFSNLPLYRPFLQSAPTFIFQSPDTGLNKLSSPQWWKPLGMSAGSRRYCIHCIREQHERFGFTTWLRSQNVARVSACSEHKTKLVVLPSSKPLLPPIQMAADTISQGSRFAPENEVFHAKYMKAILDGNLPWIPRELQDRVIRRLEFHRIREFMARNRYLDFELLPTPAKYLKSYSSGDPEISGMFGFLYWLEMDIEEFQVFKQLHFAAADDFAPSGNSNLTMAPGAVLTLDVASS